MCCIFVYHSFLLAFSLYFFNFLILSFLFSLIKKTHLPEVAIDGDARFPELHVLVDVGGVGGTTVDLEGDDAVDIDLSVASLSGHPVRWELADDLALADGAHGLEVFADAGDVSGPGSLSTTVERWFENDQV